MERGEGEEFERFETRASARLTASDAQYNSDRGAVADERWRRRLSESDAELELDDEFALLDSRDSAVAHTSTHVHVRFVAAEEEEEIDQLAPLDHAMDASAEAGGGQRRRRAEQCGGRGGDVDFVLDSAALLPSRRPPVAPDINLASGRAMFLGNTFNLAEVGTLSLEFLTANRLAHHRDAGRPGSGARATAAEEHLNCSLAVGLRGVRRWVKAIDLELREQRRVDRATGSDVLHPGLMPTAYEVKHVAGVAGRQGRGQQRVLQQTMSILSPQRVTLGGRGDSFTEYLLKEFLLTGQSDGFLYQHYILAAAGIRRQLAVRHESVRPRLLFCSSRAVQVAAASGALTSTWFSAPGETCLNSEKPCGRALAARASGLLQLRILTLAFTSSRYTLRNHPRTAWVCRSARRTAAAHRHSPTSSSLCAARAKPRRARSSETKREVRLIGSLSQPWTISLASPQDF